jgi:beta-lactamase regulating signal transducer with metallopeptidase domain
MSWLPVETVAQISVERILNALPEGFLIALFAWGLLRVLRRQNSGTRFAIWFLALLTVAALPFLSGLGAAREPIAAATSAPMSWANSWRSLRPAINMPAHWAIFVFAAWVLGACLAMARLAAGLWRLHQLRRSCSAIVASDLNLAVQKTVDAIGASGSVTVATSESVRVPAAIGFWKRTIVLPAWALRELPPDDLNAVLLHEFAHLRRWDDWTNLIQKIVRALFFFHPAVWWIESRLSVEREMACDDAVLAETANPHGYATCLVSLLEKSLSHRLQADKGLTDKRWSMAQAAVHRAREASLRLAQILDAKRPVATRIRKPAMGMAGALSVVALVLLTHAPQFVAFDRVQASDSDRVYSAVSPDLLHASSPTPAIIPAALHIGSQIDQSSSARPGIKSVHTHAVAGHAIAPAAVASQVNSARVNTAPPREQWIAINANADENTVPEFRTVVFVQTTQFITPDSSVWQVQVWRVMFVSQRRERLARVPVANSI